MQYTCHLMKASLLNVMTRVFELLLNFQTFLTFMHVRRLRGTAGDRLPKM